MTPTISNINLQVLALLKALNEASKAAQDVIKETTKEDASNNKDNSQVIESESIEANINMYG